MPRAAISKVLDSFQDPPGKLMSISLLALLSIMADVWTHSSSDTLVGNDIHCQACDSSSIGAASKFPLLVPSCLVTALIVFSGEEKTVLVCFLGLPILA